MLRLVSHAQCVGLGRYEIRLFQKKNGVGSGGVGGSGGGGLKIWNLQVY